MSTLATAFRRPAWASEMTIWTPFMPRFTKLSRKAFQQLSISPAATSTPMISRSPVAATAVATSTALEIVRPPSRTFT
jgi:hypothetical protein